jgi:saccharopine dehydrogenase-like NADP-dependent oxidoreductase
MSQENKKPENMVDCYMSAKEYYQFRLIALEKRVCFHVKWKVDKALVTTTGAFLISLGFDPGIDF